MKNLAYEMYVANPGDPRAARDGSAPRAVRSVHGYIAEFVRQLFSRMHAPQLKSA